VTDLGALVIGLGIWFGLWCLGDGIGCAGNAINAAVQYAVDNWGVFEKEDEAE
jgi:hypothetical protein